LNPERVRERLASLQSEICRAFERQDGGRFLEDAWERGGDGAAGASAGSTLAGRGLTCVLENGVLFERAGVALSDIAGSQMPPAATARNPHLAGRSFRAAGLSIVTHPRNPNVPTSHLNVRFFSAGDIWWFGGGFDLTPYLPFEDDVVLWHQAAAQACGAFHPDLYALARAQCDEYFYLRHRGESRGVGGIFYDDLNAAAEPIALSWERCFDLMQSVASHYARAYLAIVERRRDLAYGERERVYQLYRRGRYVEFNLVWDRGTLFGLQSGGRTESILMSMPPLVKWRYDWQPEASSPEAALYTDFLVHKEWL